MGWGRIRRDVRAATRSLRRRPGTAALVTTILALGIGAASSVFSVFSELVLEPLPFADADRLVRLRESVAHPNGPDRLVVATGRSFTLWRERAESFTDVAAARFQSLNLTGDERPERLTGIAATWNHFRVLGVEPALGRFFTPDEDAAGAPAGVTVLSYGLWTRRFGRDRGIVGREILLNGRPHTVIGVASPGFRYPYSAELWVPLGMSRGDEVWGDRRFNVSARLAPGVSVEGARSEMEVLEASLRREFPEAYADVGIHLRPIREEVLEGIDAQVTAVLWGAIFVLLIGGANVASLLLARFQGRRRELAVRSALGARRRDLVRQVLAEVVLLAVPGCVAGLLLASWVAPPLAGMSPVDDLGPWFQDISIDWRVTGFGAAAALLVALAAGMPAALRATGERFGSALARARGSGPDRGERRLLDGLVAGEIAVAVILLAGAGVVGKSLLATLRVDPGMQVDGLVAVGFSPSTSGYAEVPRRLAFVDEVVERVRALPDVEAAAVTNMNPFRDQGWGARVWPEGREPVVPDERITVNHRAVTPGWFRAVGTELRAGRGFRPSDDADARQVVIVSEAMAGRLWPGEEAVGKRIRGGGPVAEGDQTWLTVVGVAEDVADFGDVEDTWYRPLAQSPTEFPTQTLELFVRSADGESDVVPSVRAAIADVDPELPLYDVAPVRDVLAFERRVRAFATVLLGGFAAVGLLLAAAGVYGVLAYVVGRRTRELGIRMALGAEPGRILRQVMADAGRVAGVGLLLGLAAAAAGGRLLRGRLTDVQPLAPDVLAAIVGVIVLAAALAAWVPARRAARFDPRTVMAEE